jgi:hypothetical protein
MHASFPKERARREMQQKAFRLNGFQLLFASTCLDQCFLVFPSKIFPGRFRRSVCPRVLPSEEKGGGGKSGRGEEREEKWLCPLSLCLSLRLSLPPYRALSLPLYPSFSIPISPSLSLPPYPPLSFFSSNCSSSSRALSLSVYSSNGASSSTSVVEAFTAALSRFA